MPTRWRRSSGGRGAISVYAQGRDYHELIKGRLKQLAGRIARRFACEVKVFVDTAPLMEKPLARARGDRLAGQAHQPRLPRLRLLALPRQRPDHPGAGAGRAGSRPLRRLPRLPRRLPDQRLSRPLPARCAPLPLLPDHRARGPDPGGVPRGAGQPHLRLRRLPRRLPVEQVRPGRPRSRPQGARRPARAAAGRACRASTSAGFRAPLHRQPGQAHRPRPLRPQRALRDRQFGQSRRWRSVAARLNDGCETVREAAGWALERLAFSSAKVSPPQRKLGTSLFYGSQRPTFSMSKTRPSFRWGRGKRAAPPQCSMSISSILNTMAEPGGIGPGALVAVAEGGGHIEHPGVAGVHQLQRLGPGRDQVGRR